MQTIGCRDTAREIERLRRKSAAGLADSMTVYGKDRIGIRLVCDEKPVLSGGMETYVFLDK